MYFTVSRNRYACILPTKRFRRLRSVSQPSVPPNAFFKTDFTVSSSTAPFFFSFFSRNLFLPPPHKRSLLKTLQNFFFIVLRIRTVLSYYFPFWFYFINKQTQPIMRITSQHKSVHEFSENRFKIHSISVCIFFFSYLTLIYSTVSLAILSFPLFYFYVINYFQKTRHEQNKKRKKMS